LRKLTGYPLTIGFSTGKLVEVRVGSTSHDELTMQDESEALVLALDSFPGLDFFARLVQQNRIHGIILPECHQYSHVSGLANHWNIPTISLSDFSKLEFGRQTCIDANSGLVLVPESETDNSLIRSLTDEWTSKQKDALKHSKEVATTKGGVKFEVSAEILSVADVQVALQNGADGFGPVRCELVRDSHGFSPSSTIEVVRTMEKLTTSRPIIVRLFDFGGEKRAAEISGNAVRLSPLGMRGIRLLKDEPNYVRLVAELLAELPLDRVLFLLPMIISPIEIENFKERFPQTRDSIGVEVETPAAVYQIDEISRMVKYLHIGPSDLTQFVLAMDRSLIGPETAPLDEFVQPVLQMIEHVTHACHRANRPVSVGLDYRPARKLVSQLVKCGLRRITVSPRMVPFWKSTIRETEDSN